MFCKGKTNRRNLLGCIVLLACGALCVYGEETDLHVRRNSDSLLISMVLPRHVRPDVIQSLDEGLRSEISFEIRLYRVSVGLRSLFGDRLIREENVTWEGKRDSFENTYQIFSASGITSFSDPQVFLDTYYSLHAYSVPFRPKTGQNYYLLGRIIARETKLVPPLNLLTPFMKEYRTVTDWRRYDIPPEGDDRS